MAKDSGQVIKDALSPVLSSGNIVDASEQIFVGRGVLHGGRLMHDIGNTDEYVYLYDCADSDSTGLTPIVILYTTQENVIDNLVIPAGGIQVEEGLYAEFGKTGSSVNSEYSIFYQT